MPGENVAVGGTVATAVLLELTFTVNPPAGAFAERVSVTFWGPSPVNGIVACGQLTVAPTVTAWLAVVYPGADTLMLAEPTLTPVTTGCEAGVVWPAAIVTVDVTVTLLVSVLVSVTVTGLADATGRVTVNGADPPNPTLTGVGTPIGPPVTTVTFAVASGIKMVALAWITVVPSVNAVTGTFAVVAPGAKVTVAGVVATRVLLELTFTVTPPAGAGELSVNVRF
jgi:hypothetical protein